MERVSSRLSGVVLALIIAAAAFLIMGGALAQPAFAEEVVEFNEYVVGGNTYIALELAADDANGRVALTTAKKAAKVTLPAAVTLPDGKDYNVTGIGSGAFKETGTKTVIVKTKLLTKASDVRGSLKGSKVKTIKVSVGKESAKYVKKYKKIFTKANAGKKVTVK